MEQKIDIIDFGNYLEEIIVRDEEILKPYWEEVERKEENHQNTYIPMTPEQSLAVKELEAVWYLQSELDKNDIEQIREKRVK